MKPPTPERTVRDSVDIAVTPDRPPSIPWCPILIAATVAACAAATATWTMTAGDTPAREAVTGRLAAWYGWILLAPLVATASHRLVARRAGIARALTAHLGLLIAFAACHAAFVSTARWTAREDPRESWLAVAGRVAWPDVEASILAYLALAGSSHALLYRSRHITSRARVRDLERALVQARLLTLQRQLQPHFLFNALNAIASLMYRDVPSAEQALVTLGDLLRTSLERSGMQQVPLAAELDVVRAYLRIEQLRLEDPLSVGFDVEPGAERALLPNLLLQPLVENAVRHGVSRRRGAGRIDVRARRDGRHLRVEVQDNGPGLPRDAVAALRGGVGISTTRARLRDLFGADFRFEFHHLPQGLSVLVVVPWQTAAESSRGDDTHDEDAEVPDRGRRTTGAGAAGPAAAG